VERGGRERAGLVRTTKVDYIYQDCWQSLSLGGANFIPLSETGRILYKDNKHDTHVL
jgi:hypothetical protein